MSDAEVPEADALEQSRTIEPIDVAEAPSSDPEVPEADARDQALPVGEYDERDR